MSVYKIIQDIEAEDKLVGPFALRQFIYMLIVAASLFLGFKLGEAAWWLSLIVLPHTTFFFLLAMPLGGGQPTEVWLLAKFRFAIKPRKHIWQQEAAHQLVTITVPKKVEKHLTKDMSQTQVKSQLQNLASTLDSHGWSSKHIAADPFSGAAMNSASAVPQSDRLVPVTPGSAQQSQDYNPLDEKDILDSVNNPTAKKLDAMIESSSRARRLQIMKKMKQGPKKYANPHLKTIEPLHDLSKKPSFTQSPQADQRPKAPGIVLPPALGVAVQPPPQQATPSAQAPQRTQATPPPAAPPPPPAVPPPPQARRTAPPPAAGGSVVAPDPAAVAKRREERIPAPEEPSRPLTDQELLEKIHNDKEKPKNYGHMRVVHPLGEGPPPEAQAQPAASQQQAPPPPQSSNTGAPGQAQQPPKKRDRDIIELANNDDLNVETLARQANKNRAKAAKGEVVINLHDDDE